MGPKELRVYQSWHKLSVQIKIKLEDSNVGQFEQVDQFDKLVCARIIVNEDIIGKAPDKQDK